jgi:hypothetical protein
MRKIVCDDEAVHTDARKDPTRFEFGENPVRYQVRRYVAMCVHREGPTDCCGHDRTVAIDEWHTGDQGGAAGAQDCSKPVRRLRLTIVKEGFTIEA